MTRRDYVLVAKIIKTLPVAWRGVARESFATEFLKDKPTFNVEAFRKGCQ